MYIKNVIISLYLQALSILHLYMQVSELIKNRIINKKLDLNG